MNGGYVLIDAAGLNPNDESGAIPGLYERFVAAMATNKPMFICNMNLSETGNVDERMSPGAVQANMESGNVKAYIFPITLQITPEDEWSLVL